MNLALTSSPEGMRIAAAPVEISAEAEPTLA
jgi:hypothetical protein